ncbi:STAS domain-containing protein [Jatrophihabitans fulvus]
MGEASDEERTAFVVHVAMPEVDFSNVVVARHHIASALATAADHDIVLDLAEVTFIDSSGINMLITVREDLNRRGRSVTLRGLRTQPARVLDLMGLLGTVFRHDRI